MTDARATEAAADPGAAPDAPAVHRYGPIPPPASAAPDPALAFEPAYEQLVHEAYQAHGGWAMVRLLSGSALAMRVVVAGHLWKREFWLVRDDAEPGVYGGNAREAFRVEMSEAMAAATRHDARLGISWSLGRRGRRQSGGYAAEFLARYVGESTLQPAVPEPPADLFSAAQVPA